MAETKMQLVDWLDDLTVRFLLNLPHAELSSVPRLCFQVEEAQWYYEDFIRPASAAAGNPLPSLHLRQFCLLLFQHCPLLSGFTDAQHLAAYDEFLAYKTRVPVRGAILMDDAMEKVVLVKGWKKSASWSFPRGKINKDEKDLDCAIREVDEETGFDVRAAGLVPADERDAKYIDVEMKGQQLRMFVFRNVPTETLFAPKTRKEISKIAWYNVRDLPGFKKSKNRADIEGMTNKFYMVAPFLPQLKRWIGQQRQQDALAVHTFPMDTEGDTTDAYIDEHMIESAHTDRSAELKKLLSIGGASPAALTIETQERVSPHNTAGMDLLAMLQGTAKSTSLQPPLSQVDAFPHQSSSPHSHHTGLSYRAGMQQPPPQFPASLTDVRAQQPARIVSMTTTPDLGVSDYPHAAGAFPAHALYAQQQRQRNASSVPQPPSVYTTTTDVYRLAQATPATQQPTHNLHPSRFPPTRIALESPGYDEQAIANGPSAPKASQLPPPNLNLHSMRLLDAFKGGESKVLPSPLGPITASKPSAQQAALLDLFEKPVVAPFSKGLAADKGPSEPTSMAKSNAPPERRLTLNEITRTLPVGTTTRKSSSSVNTGATETARLTSQDRLSVTAEPSKSAVQQPQILQRPSNERKPLSPRAGPRKTSATAPKLPENGLPSVPIKTLQRPGSARGSNVPSPSDLLRAGSPKMQQNFQPQLLRRDKTIEGAGPKLPSTSQGTVGTTGDKASHLLTLFGKSHTNSAATPAFATSSPESAVEGLEPRSEKDKLLDLSTPASGPAPPAGGSAAVPDILTPPEPPSAPRLSPSTRPRRSIVAAENNQQQTLLSLFTHKPRQFDSTTTSAVASPGTPISPFALPTPAQKAALASIFDPRNGQSSGPNFNRNMGNRTPTPFGVGGNSPASGPETGMLDRKPTLVSPVAQTPTEHKDFLLGYLNNVVQNAGNKDVAKP